MTNIVNKPSGDNSNGSFHPSGNSTNVECFDTIGLGSRVMYVEDGAIGTVRYIGPLHGRGNGYWFGVDWDEGESRGRHDGSYEGIRYFTASSSTSGSFLRNVTGRLVGGIDFMQAVEERYTEDLVLPGASDDLLFCGNNKVDTQIELYGMEKLHSGLRKLTNLQAVHLADSTLCKAGESVSRASTELPQVGVLNIAHCLLNSWLEVGRIVNHLKLVRQIMVSRNPLALPDDESNDVFLSSAFSNVQRVIGVNIGISDWSQVARVSSWFGQLEELVIAYNGISSIDLTQVWCAPFLGVTNLDISNNPLNGSSEKFALLGRMQHLRILSMRNCGLANFCLPPAPPSSQSAISNDAECSIWPDLFSISLIGNEINSWDFLNELNQLEALQELSFSDNPVNRQCDNHETARQIMIAGVGSLILLNHVEVSAKERRGAERDYLKRHGKAWVASGGGGIHAENQHEHVGVRGVSAQFLLMHPRWAQLCLAHGAPEPSEFVEQSTTLKNVLLHVRLRAELGDEGTPFGTELERSIPGTMSVGHLRSLVRRLFKLNVTNKLELRYQSHRDPSRLEYSMERDTRQINFYEVEDGDLIIAKLCDAGVKAKS